MSDVEGALQLNTWGDAFVPGYERAIAFNDWAGAADDMRHTISGIPPTAGNTRYLIPRFLQPRLAYALARGGAQAEAETVLSTLPTDRYHCLWARGWVATMARDWGRADREFAAAVRLAPSLPLAYAAWGESLAARGDPAGAIAKFKQATERGPHFAYPLKAWGDLLVGEGRWRDALTKYDAALKYTRAWVECTRRGTRRRGGADSPGTAEIHLYHPSAPLLPDHVRRRSVGKTRQELALMPARRHGIRSL